MEKRRVREKRVRVTAAMIKEVMRELHLWRERRDEVTSAVAADVTRTYLEAWSKALRRGFDAATEGSSSA